MLKWLIPALALIAAPAMAQQAQVSSSVKTFDNNTTAPLQLDINGNLKVVGSATGSSADQVQGNVASGAADSGNPVKVGCVYNAAAPTVASGQRVDCQASTRGSLNVSIKDDTNGFPASFALLNAAVSQSSYAGLVNIGVVYGFDGTNLARVPGDTSGLVVQKGLSSTAWTYASGTAGILSNTTAAVTFKAAAGASIRNYIDSCQINTTAFGSASPLAFRDGAGGTVIFALNVPSAGFLNPVSIVFETPLKSTANTLLEVVTTTANVSGTAYVNCQGHTGS